MFRHLRGRTVICEEVESAIEAVAAKRPSAKNEKSRSTVLAQASFVGLQEVDQRRSVHGSI